MPIGCWREILVASFLLFCPRKTIQTRPNFTQLSVTSGSDANPIARAGQLSTCQRYKRGLRPGADRHRAELGLAPRGASPKPTLAGVPDGSRGAGTVHDFGVPVHGT